MTDEERQRQMDFILNQQAQFVTDIQSLQEAHVAAEKRMTRLESTVVKVYQETTSNLNALIESQEGMVQAQQRTDERLRETDERLNVFVSVVERYISGGNGKRTPARKQSGKQASKKKSGKK
ncbi:MAG: hypothetical protein M3458_16260 [Acidobacteriota bacterium]|nr:hypothetical protein [Acidobacteriota bacterium]